MTKHIVKSRGELRLPMDFGEALGDLLKVKPLPKKHPAKKQVKPKGRRR